MSLANEKYTFWFSQKHAEHYARMNQTASSPFAFEGIMIDDVCRKNFFIEGDKRVPYTACTTKEGAREPFSGALRTFPDYVKIGEGTIRNILTEGKW